MTKQADLLAYLFEVVPPHATTSGLAAELMDWMNASARFTTFVDTYRDKIRKKIRVTREAESILDVRSELEVACRLLNNRHLEVAYEPYASAKRRGPDFSIRYRVNLVFNIEVARLRVDESEIARAEQRIRRILLDKLEQMQPGMPNLLIIHTRPGLARNLDLAGIMQTVKNQVESKDPAFYAASRYHSPANFYKHFLHLSGVLLWTPGGSVWVNKQARPALAENVLRIVARAADEGQDSTHS